MEKILSGKPVSKFISNQIENLVISLDTLPKMALIRVGTDPASAYYVQNIIRQATKLRIEVDWIDLPETIQTGALIEIIQQFNSDYSVHGIMVQKPLPKHISEEVINNCVNPEKDIDGIHPINLGKLFLGEDCYVPGTAQAVIELIKYYQIDTIGKHVVILGRSPVVAKPLAGMLLQKTDYGNATVTVCHSYTKNLTSVIKSADILVTAIGKPNYIISDMISDNTICIDVGINLIQDDEKGDIYVGDIDFNSCFEKALAITPVPGGVGSITTSVLLNNLLKATLNHNKQKKS